MKSLLITLLLLVPDLDLNKISKINSLKKQATEAYENGDMQTAITRFRTLTDSLEVREDPILLNLANAYFNTQDTSQAIQLYASVLGSDNNQLRSKAYQQLGVINHQQNKMNEALSHFKLALKHDPGNEAARYNYELLKKIMKDQDQDQEDQDKDIEPSEYAKQLKAQADALAAKNLFDQALKIMQMGLQEDETVAAYNNFISKLNDVVTSQQDE